MIKINLLPKSIGQSSLSQFTAGIGAFFLVLVVVGLLGYYHTVMVPKTEAMEEQASKTEALKLTVQGLQADAAAQDALIAPIQAKIDFVYAVLDYNKKYPTLYKKVATWTYDQIVLSSMSTSGGTLTMNARAKSLEDLGRYLLNMYRATELFTSVSISNVPSYPGRSAVPNNGRGPIIQTPLDFTVTCQLKEPFSPPSPPSGGAAASPAAAGPGGGMPGMGGGMPGAGAGMPGAGGGMPGMGMGPGAKAGGMGGGMPPAMSGGMPGMGMGPGAKAGGMGGGLPVPPAGGGMPMGPGAKN